ncbi:MAG: hypothetical protein ACI4F7_03365 [Acutalibacteraceae bacterium]
MFNFCALWIRLIFLAVIGLIGIFLVLFFGKKLKGWEKITAVVLAVALIALGGGSTLKALIKPKVKTVTGTYLCEYKTKSLNPFETDYCFECVEGNIYLETDPFSIKMIYSNPFIEGEQYTVSYEESTNLIVAVSE